MFGLFRKKEKKNFMQQQFDRVFTLLKKGRTEEAKIYAAAIITAIIQDYFDAFGTRWVKFEKEFKKIDEIEEKAKKLLERNPDDLTRDEIYDISRFYYIGDDYKAKTKLTTYYFCSQLITASDSLTEMFKIAGSEFTPEHWMDLIYPGGGWKIGDDKKIKDYKDLLARKINCNQKIVDIVSRYQENDELISLEDSSYEKITFRMLTIRTGNPHLPSLIHPETVSLIIKNMDKVRKAADVETFKDKYRETDIYSSSGSLLFLPNPLIFHPDENLRLRELFCFRDFFRCDEEHFYDMKSIYMPDAICAIDKIYKERFGNGHSAHYEASKYKICTDILNEILGFEHADPVKEINKPYVNVWP